MIDKLVKNNIIHKNKAAHIKSKLVKKVNSLKIEPTQNERYYYLYNSNVEYGKYAETLVEYREEREKFLYSSAKSTTST